MRTTLALQLPDATEQNDLIPATPGTSTTLDGGPVGGVSQLDDDDPVQADIDYSKTEVGEITCTSGDVGACDATSPSVTVDPETGEITFTTSDDPDHPTPGGVYSIPVTYYDENGEHVTVIHTVTVQDPPTAEDREKTTDIGTPVWLDPTPTADPDVDSASIDHTKTEIGTILDADGQPVADGVATAVEDYGGNTGIKVTATEPGVYTVPVTYYDNLGQTVTVTLTVTITSDPSVSLVKSANPSEHFTVGQEVAYSFVVTNTGNVTLTDLTVDDPLTGLSEIDCPVTKLAAGEQTVCTATYTVTQADVDAGSLANTATVTGTPPTGEPVKADGSVTIPGSPEPGLTVEKSADPTSGHVGDEVVFTVKATNSGNVTLRDVKVADSLDGLSALDCGDFDGTLLPGEFVECAATYTLAQADLMAGSVVNQATASASDPDDNTVNADPAEASVTVLPTATDDEASTGVDTPVTIDVVDNDNGSQLSLTSVDETSANGGSVEIVDGQAVYTPPPGFVGTDTFTYIVTDEYGNTATAKVTVTVAPAGADDTNTTAANTPVDGSVFDNDTTTGDVQVTGHTNPSHGTVEINADGTYTYTPADGFSGEDTFTYTATDSVGEPYTQTVRITVTPTADDDTASTAADTPATINVLDGDQGSDLKVVAVPAQGEAGGPTHGTVTVNDDGTLTYTPDSGFSGTDTFTYTAVDGSGQQVTATVTVTVTPKAGDTTPPPADDTTPPPANDTTPPPANDTTPPPADNNTGGTFVVGGPQPDTSTPTDTTTNTTDVDTGDETTTDSDDETVDEDSAAALTGGELSQANSVAAVAALLFAAGAVTVVAAARRREPQSARVPVERRG
jgi:uncharacterized repeat protein (TIGR01451 family)